MKKYILLLTAFFALNACTVVEQERHINIAESANIKQTDDFSTKILSDILGTYQSGDRTIRYFIDEELGQRVRYTQDTPEKYEYSEYSFKIKQNNNGDFMLKVLMDEDEETLIAMHFIVDIKHGNLYQYIAVIDPETPYEEWKLFAHPNIEYRVK